MATIAELTAEAEHRMQKSIEAAQHEFSTLRTGRANPTILDGITVEAYGSAMPINQLAGISVPDAHQVVISPWDRGTLQAIEKAILKSDIGLVPNVDGSAIRLNIPPLTEERRKDLVKQIHKRMEECRVEIRNLRRDAADQLKRDEHAGTLGEDDLRREMEQLQRITDKHVGDVDHVGAAKEQEIMEV